MYFSGFDYIVQCTKLLLKGDILPLICYVICSGSKQRHISVWPMHLEPPRIPLTVAHM